MARDILSPTSDDTFGGDTGAAILGGDGKVLYSALPDALGVATRELGFSVLATNFLSGTTVETAITGVQLNSIVIAAGAPIMIECYISALANSVSGAVSSCFLKENGSVIGQAFTIAQAATASPVPFTIRSRRSTPGTYTYTVTVACASGATIIGSNTHLHATLI